MEQGGLQGDYNPMSSQGLQKLTQKWEKIILLIWPSSFETLVDLEGTINLVKGLDGYGKIGITTWTERFSQEILWCPL